MAYSFGSSGATPANNTSTPLSAGSLNLSSTPQSKALSTAANPFKTGVPGAGQSLTPAVNSATSAFNTTPRPVASSVTGNMPSAGVLAPPANVQPTSHAVTSTDSSGNTTTTKQTYAPPIQTAPQASTTTTAPQGTANGSVSENTNGSLFPAVTGALANTANQGSPQQQQVTQNLANTSSAGNAQGQAATANLANTSQASSPAATAAQQATADAGMLNPALAANAEQIGNTYGGQIANENTSLMEQEAENANSGYVGGLGRAGAIAASGGEYLQGLSTAEQAALAGNAQGLTAANQQASAENEAGQLANTQQSNIQSGLNEAGGLANTAQSNTQSGLESAGSLANTAQANKQSGLNQAGTLTYPITLSASSGQYLEGPNGESIGGGSTGGIAAYQNFQNALSNSSIATSNASIASGISQNMQQLSNTGGQVIQEMGLSGANWASTPVANQAIGAYMANLNPTAKTTIQNGLNDMQSYVSAILGSLPGQTPTALTDAVQSADFSKLSPIQLSDFLSNVQNYAASRLQPIQQTAANAESANLGGAPAATPLYMGNTANAGAMNPGTANSTGTAVAGSALSAGASLFSSLLSELGGAVKSAISGGAAGEAAGAVNGSGAAAALLAP